MKHLPAHTNCSSIDNCQVDISSIFCRRFGIFRGIWKFGGKQWQTTPKNLPRMQCARAIPVTWLGSGSCQARPSRLNTNEWWIWKLLSIHSIISRENRNYIPRDPVSEHCCGYAGVIDAQVRFVSLKLHVDKFTFYASESILIHSLAFDGVIYISLYW